MKKNVYYVFSVLCVGLFLSLFVLYTPYPNNTDDSAFNTLYATEYIAEISKEPHSVTDYEAHEEVRVYLKDKLSEFIGEENVMEMNYDRSLFDTDEPLTYDVKNLLGVIPGKSDTGILIVGHYDSRGFIGRVGELGESYGAADDGYAIATMLEIARLYGNQDLENSIYILMTDAEETGLYGAEMAAKEDFMDKIGFVINIEARGTSGPAYMFETSLNNDKVIDFYTNAELPVSYSLATAVYTVMPNSTDFTKFLEEEKNGINFSVLKGLEHYHTPFDNYTNIDTSSIEHYGRQIIPLVDEFTMNEKYSDVNYFDGEQDAVFFTLFSNIFISYTETTGLVLSVITLIAFVTFVAFSMVKKELNVKDILYGLLIFLGSFLVAILFGQIVARVVAFVNKIPFSLTYVRVGNAGLPTLLTLGALAILLSYFYLNKASSNKKGLIVVGTFINLLLAIATGLVLSGASFLFFVVGLSGVVVMYLNKFCKKSIVKYIIYGLIMILNIIIVVPIIYSLYLAITVGGLLVFGVILVFYLIVLIPMMEHQLDI